MGRVHGVGIAEIRQILRHLHHVAPAGTDLVEDRLDRVHARLVCSSIECG
jgi:hypothetical protein